MTQTTPETGPAQSGNGRTVHRVRIDGFHLNALCGRSADRRLTDREAAKMGKTCTRCTTAEEKLLAAAPVEETPAPAVEKAPAPAPAETGPRVHHFPDSETAYDATQCSEDIKDGDVLVVASEGIVGVLTNAWPVALTEAHGELHPTAGRYRIREMNDGRYENSADIAEQTANELGLSLLPQHQAPAEAPAEQAAPEATPELRTLTGMKAPFLLWGRTDRAGAFVPAQTYRQAADAPALVVETREDNGLRARLDDGREVTLYGALLRYWVAPAPEASPAAEEAPVPAVEDDEPEHCMPIMGGKVHSITPGMDGSDGRPEHVFPLCRTGAMTNRGTRYRKVELDLTCANCIEYRNRRRLAREAAQAAPAPVEEVPAAPAAEQAPQVPQQAVLNVTTTDTRGDAMIRRNQAVREFFHGGPTAPAPVEEAPAAADSIRATAAAEAREVAVKLEAQALTTNEVIAARARAILTGAGHVEHVTDRAGFSFRINHLGVRLYAVDATGTELTGTPLDDAFDAYTETLEARDWYVRPGSGFHGSSLSLLPPADQVEEVVSEGKRRREAAEAPVQEAPAAPAAEEAPQGAQCAELTAEVGVRGAIAARFATAHTYQEVQDTTGARIGWTFRHGFGAHARYGWAHIAGRLSQPNHGSEYRWQADRDLRQIHADGAGQGPDNLLALLADEQRPTPAQLQQMRDDLLAVDTVRLTLDGLNKWAVQRGPHYMGTVHDEGPRTRRGRYAAWSPYADRRDGIVGFFHDLDEARDAVAAAWPVSVAEVAGETGASVADVFAAAEALDAELRKADGRAVLRIEKYRGAETRITQSAAAAIEEALNGSVDLVADRAGLTRDEVRAEADQMALAWSASGKGSVWRDGHTLTPAVTAVLLHRLALPYHGPAWYTGERAICGYDDHTAPLNADGRLAVHERRPGVYGNHCPGSLRTPRGHRDDKTRQWTTAFSYTSPRPDALACSAKPGDAVEIDGTEYRVADAQADLDTRQHVHLVLSDHGGPLRFTLDERVTYTRRVRKQDVACQECGVYVVAESDEATDGSLAGRLCGACDRPDAEMTEDRARELAARVWPKAEEFRAERDDEGRLLGYTFRAGRLHSARYGWVAPSATVCQGLEDYRSHAAALLPMVARDERETRRNPAV